MTTTDPTVDDLAQICAALACDEACELMDEIYVDDLTACEISRTADCSAAWQDRLRRLVPEPSGPTHHRRRRRLATQPQLRTSVHVVVRGVGAAVGRRHNPPVHLVGDEPPPSQIAQIAIRSRGHGVVAATGALLRRVLRSRSQSHNPQSAPDRKWLCVAAICPHRQTDVLVRLALLSKVTMVAV
jgi:hypothetical protein